MSRTRLEELLDLAVPPVAISFLAAAPAGVPHVAAAEPASCGFWRRASAGESFYTDAADHLNCAVGAHTHGVPTTEAQKQDLMTLIRTMVDLEYLRMEEVPSIPHRTGEFGVVVYAPLAEARSTPDVVLVRARVRELMLLAEAAQAAGVGSAAPTLGRPTCAVLPQAMASGRASASFGCVGNRVYTGAGDDEGYFAIPGDKLEAVVERLAVVRRANETLRQFHEQRRASLA